MIKPIVAGVIILAVIIAYRKTRRWRYQRTVLIGRRGQGDQPKMKYGNPCTSGANCGNRAESGEKAEPGLCEHCRKHGPYGRNRK